MEELIKELVKRMENMVDERIANSLCMLRDDVKKDTVQHIKDIQLSKIDQDLVLRTVQERVEDELDDIITDKVREELHDLDIQVDIDASAYVK